MAKVNNKAETQKKKESTLLKKKDSKLAESSKNAKNIQKSKQKKTALKQSFNFYYSPSLIYKTPSVPGPQCEVIVEPATVSRIFSKPLSFKASRTESTTSCSIAV